MKKKGFTLVELLAVIAILAILVIIALPNVLGMFNSAKKNTFVTELQSIYDTASKQFISDSMGKRNSGHGIAYARIGGSTFTSDKGEATGFRRPSKTVADYSKIDLQGTTTIDFYIEFNLAGDVVTYYATDNQYQYAYEGDGLKKEDIVAKDLAESAANCVTAKHSVKFTPLSGNVDTGVVTISDAKEYCGKSNFTLIDLTNESTAKFDLSAGNPNLP